MAFCALEKRDGGPVFETTNTMVMGDQHRLIQQSLFKAPYIMIVSSVS